MSDVFFGGGGHSKEILKAFKGPDGSDYLLLIRTKNALNNTIAG